MPLHQRVARRILLGACAGLLLAAGAQASEDLIRKNLGERLRGFQKIDEVRKTPVPGLYEVRLGTDIWYTDSQGNHLIEGGHLIDVRTRTDLTAARIDKLTAIDFATLPLKDAIVWKQGAGERRLVVFADPNCGYCKQLERDIQQLKNVTVYTFLLPILGPDSAQKSRNIWCAKDNTQAWLGWMLEGTPPIRNMGPCDTSALERNVAMGRKYKVNGTPALVFEDGKRVPGAMGLAQIEQQLVASRAR
jgi:thiol:disulfide interchange protein DsbC